jgi:benzoylformate decarboxylase
MTFVVMNNNEYNVLKAFMRSQAHYGAARTGRFIAMDIAHPAIDFAALARSMGLVARRIDRAAIASGAPDLIEILIAAT